MRRSLPFFSTSFYLFDDQQSLAATEDQQKKFTAEAQSSSSSCFQTLAPGVLSGPEKKLNYRNLD